MITVITNPSDHNFSRSPVICELETDNMFTSGDFGLHAQFVFYIPTNPANNDEFVVREFGGASQTFVFTNGVNPLKWTIPLRSIGQTDTQYYNIILGRLVLSSMFTDYDITYIGGGGFKFIARLPGNTYSDGGCGINVGSGYSFNNLVNGTNNFLTNVPRPNYKLAVDLWVERTSSFPSGPFDLVYSSEKEPVNNRFRIDLSRMLDIQLEYYFPAANLNIGVHCNQTCKRFYVVLRELYGNPATNQVTYAQPNSALAAPGQPITFSAHILKSGLAPRWNKIQPIQQLSAYVWSYPLNLTTKNTRRIKLYQPEFLFFCFSSHVIYPKLRITTFYANGTTNVAYQSLFNGAMREGFVGCFPVTPAGSIPFYEMLNGDAVKFEAVVVESSNPTVPVSQPMTYIPDYADLGQNRIFLFTNSMGGVDTFRTEGSYEHDVEFESVVSSRNYFTSDPGHLGSTVESGQFKTDKFNAYSGWMSKEDANWLEDFFLAKYKVEVIDQILYVPIRILSKGYRRHESDENLFRVEFQYMHQQTSPVTDRLAAAL